MNLMSLTNDAKLNIEPPFYGGSFFFFVKCWLLFVYFGVILNLVRNLFVRLCFYGTK